MFVCVCVCVCVCVFVCVRVCVCARARASVSCHVHTHARTQTHAHTHAATHCVQSSTLLTLFHTSFRMGSILSWAGLLSQHTGMCHIKLERARARALVTPPTPYTPAPIDANSWLRGTISSAVWEGEGGGGRHHTAVKFNKKFGFHFHEKFGFQFKFYLADEVRVSLSESCHVSGGKGIHDGVEEDGETASVVAVCLH